MTAPLPRAARARRGAALLLALVIGAATLAITNDDGDDRALPVTTSTSAPRVLGTVVTAAPEASPARPAEVDVPPTGRTGATGAAGPTRASTTTRRAPATSAAPSSTSTSGGTDPTLIPATVIENTTTTEAPTSTTDDTTSTTADPTSTTAAPTSTTTG